MIGTVYNFDSVCRFTKYIPACNELISNSPEDSSEGFIVKITCPDEV